MVNFVLEEFGKVVAGTESLGSAGEVEVADFDFAVALEFDHQIGKREAVVPESEFFVAGPGDGGVQDFEALRMDFDIDGTERLADLDGGDPAAEAVAALEFMKSIGQVTQQGAGGRKIRDRERNRAQEGITEFDDFPGGHTEMVTMGRIPLLVTWFAVLSGYLPYNLSLAFLNPFIALCYSFLAWPLAASWGNARQAAGVTAATLAGGWVVANWAAGTPELVLPSWGVVVACAALLGSAAWAAVGLRSDLVRRGHDEERVVLWLRLGFLGLAAVVYFNGSLPYEWKMYLAERTTNGHLIGLAWGWTALFVGTWRMTK